MKKIIAIILAVLIIAFSFVGCASWQRTINDLKSDISGGLKRVINVYTADGKLLATYKGKIDIDTNDGGYVKFDFNGKRYIYYNCFIETIAEL